eukprot:Nitzschia sp. Nitz4//scaffold158_size52425//13336//14028//NITZ4_006855-RA/size52425-processed-gene-0.49-mRNA-1//-1//CDS//3329537501//7912//frame0
MNNSLKCLLVLVWATCVSSFIPHAALLKPLASPSALPVTITPRNFDARKADLSSLSSAAIMDGTAEATTTVPQVVVSTAPAVSATKFAETNTRSAVKSLLWRLIAGSVTFATSYSFSGGSISQALSIVSSDFLSKAFTMFLGERLMNRSSAGRGKGHDSASRSLVKALIWRLFAVANTLTLAIFVSKDLSIASKIAGTDAIFKTALMFAYERIWAGVSWGKRYAATVKMD